MAPTSYLREYTARGASEFTAIDAGAIEDQEQEMDHLHSETVCDY